MQVSGQTSNFIGRCFIATHTHEGSTGDLFKTTWKAHPLLKFH